MRFLFFLILYSCFVFTTVLCQEQELDLQVQESVPISSSMGLDLVKMVRNQQNNDVVNLGIEKIQELFEAVDTRGIDENDPSYVLLNMDMDFVNIKTGNVIAPNNLFKGSGTVLYCSNNHILVLTAYHNLYQEESLDLDSAFSISRMSILKDNRDRQHKDITLAEMVDSNYVQVGKKDIALVAMELRQGGDLFEDDMVVHNILDFKRIQQSGKANRVEVQINQYPAFFDWYIKTVGTVYHDGIRGYHYIPTLPGASGSGVMIDNNIIGVHVRSGIRVPLDVKNIRYNNRNLLVENNIFELISMDDIEQVSVQLSNIEDKTLLTDLVKKFVNNINKQKRKELIRYLKYERKIKKDKDTNPDFLKAINKLNAETRFWTSYVFWLKDITEITDDIVDAYNSYDDIAAKTEL